ncbi:cytochrome c biogenesis heme-transporting ATPase CcmA [Colwellia sp. 1_MG-2023]|uniref:cytochrome c biogenesis heme-transporting ATPase CcmA n=1 Tax=Colwellia sp. 1_MG-2023 TaxID=3062649 RepID=UPI0026E35768|nr:cytochrome c biogenesis heme-transporting ATPase CcmA [Colwellia sp. 1_MG-2023]MDO6447123.1 cytochrome c biogenesis heme-transporting ATPase CcmA [Colwellia sp. 1_MG-2023]
MPAHSPSLLSAHQLTCIREERILFEHLNLTINCGDIIQVEGPNGAGKTSLLRILAGLSQPYEGQVHFNEIAINDEREFYNQNLLYIGHLAGIKGEMTAQENLEFALSLSGLDAFTAEQTLNQVDLLGFEDALASHLSAGQHRRIALAKLWQSKAPVWILDEPFTAIDKNGVKKLEQLMVNHAKNGGCVILTTHQDLSIDKNLYKKVTLEYRFF